MPYIKEKRRPRIDKAVDKVVKAINSLDDRGNPGDLNYAITTLVMKILMERGQPTYQTLGQAGVMTLECAKLEFYRKCMAAYERAKEDENGRVYPEIVFIDGHIEGGNDRLEWGEMPQVKREAGHGKKKGKKR